MGHRLGRQAEVTVRAKPKQLRDGPGLKRQYDVLAEEKEEG